MLVILKNIIMQTWTCQFHLVSNKDMTSQSNLILRVLKGVYSTAYFNSEFCFVLFCFFVLFYFVLFLIHFYFLLLREKFLLPMCPIELTFELASPQYCIRSNQDNFEFMFTLSNVHVIVPKVNKRF